MKERRIESRGHDRTFEITVQETPDSRKRRVESPRRSKMDRNVKVP